MANFAVFHDPGHCSPDKLYPATRLSWGLGTSPAGQLEPANVGRVRVCHCSPPVNTLRPGKTPGIRPRPLLTPDHAASQHHRVCVTVEPIWSHFIHTAATTPCDSADSKETSPRDGLTHTRSQPSSQDPRNLPLPPPNTWFDMAAAARRPRASRGTAQTKSPQTKPFPTPHKLTRRILPASDPAEPLQILFEPSSPIRASCAAAGNGSQAGTARPHRTVPYRTARARRSVLSLPSLPPSLAPSLPAAAGSKQQGAAQFLHGRGADGWRGGGRD